ncbi:MAG: heterodisulfide reductase subunit B, partial [Candidatus Sericytochromatia bacterium]|nr:heterodisulfide reductase subunit B [Candidatus Tanganyikabacteria bacterium]
VADVRDLMWQLERDGEIVVHRVRDEHAPVTVKTLYGWDKRIPTTQLWHHKSCGQCGNIPGYPASLLWMMNELDVRYLDETDQTSCTAWNYHGSGIGNLESLAAVFLRNFHQAYVSSRAEGLPDGYYYPLVHCGTSFGNYKEVREYLLHSAELRERVTKILAKLGRLVDGKLLIPEEIVHYSEWVHVMRERIAERQEIDCGQVRATIHPACHVYKMVPADAIYDDGILEGNRVAVSTGIMEALGAQVIDYSTWYDCCGFGFRHIISEREFTRSFAIDRKVRVAVEEARADVMIGHDTGCITTLDKNQWIGKAVGKDYQLPILADIQFAALVCGAHPFKIVQSHWHASAVESLMEKLGIDWRAKKAEFEAYLEAIKTAKPDSLYDPRRMITSGPGYKPLAARR